MYADIYPMHSIDLSSLYHKMSTDIYPIHSLDLSNLYYIDFP